MLNELITDQSEPSEDTENLPVPDAEDFDNNASQFTTDMINSADTTNIYGGLERGLSDDATEEVPHESTENSIISGPPPLQIAVAQDAGGDDDQLIPVAPITNQTIPDPFTASGPPILNGRSILYHHFVQKKVVFLSFDTEVGGEYCGIVQMTAELARVDLNQTRTKKGTISPNKDFSSNVRREPATFNHFIKPNDGALWDEQCTRIHGLHEYHPSI